MQEEGESLKSGTYPARLVSVTADKSKASGNPMWVWEFKLLDPNYTGFNPRVFTALTPAAQWKVAETVAAFGIEPKEGKLEFEKTDVIGVVVDLEIVVEQVDGKSRLNVEKVVKASKTTKSKHKDKKTEAPDNSDIPF